MVAYVLWAPSGNNDFWTLQTYPEEDEAKDEECEEDV